MIDQGAKLLLETLARVNRSFKDRAVELRRLAGVKSVHASLEVISCQSGPALEGYLEVNFGKNDWACWFLDVSSNVDSWIIDARLDRKCGVGTKTVYEIPSKVIDNFQEFALELEQTVHKLLTIEPIISQPLT